MLYRTCGKSEIEKNWVTVRYGRFNSGAYDCDGVVEKRLAKDDDIKDFVDVDFFKNCQHGDRIDGTNEGCKKKRVQ